MTKQTALEQVVDDWNRGVANWDANKLACIYTEDAMLFGGRPGHYVGRDSIREYYASYESVISTGAMCMSQTEIRTLGEDYVLAQGIVDFNFKLAGEVQTRSTLRATLVLRRVAAGWKIADHHFSPTPAVPPLGKD